jgi:hypothetical protein
VSSSDGFHRNTTFSRRVACFQEKTVSSSDGLHRNTTFSRRVACFQEKTVSSSDGFHRNTTSRDDARGNRRVKKSDREEAKATRVLHTTPHAPHAARAPQLPPQHAPLHHLLRRPPPRRRRWRHRRRAGRAHRRGPARGSRLNRWARLGPQEQRRPPQEQRRPPRCALPLLTLSPSSPSVHSTRTARLCLHGCARHVHAPLACFKEESRSAPSTSPCSSLYPLFLSRFRLFRQRIHFMFLLLASAVPILLPAVFLNTTTHNHGPQLTPPLLLSTPPPPCSLRRR